jgi:DNA-binding SARP family transcriptional activator
MNQTRHHDPDLLSVRVLGPFQAVRNREEISLGPRRQQAVLLPLMLRPGRIVTGEELIDSVWGEAVPASGIALVRTYISRLRLLLGRDVIGYCAAGYHVRLDPGQVDLTVFDQYVTRARELRRRAQLGPSATAWRKALELWRGSPLPRIPGPFAERQRQRLTDLYLSALEECWDTEILLGRHAELLVELSAAVRDYPLRENLTRLLMLASYRSGRQADAVAAFEQTRRRLAEELGVRPALGLQELHDRIRSGDPELMYPPYASDLTRCGLCS